MIGNNLRNVFATRPVETTMDLVDMAEQICLANEVRCNVEETFHMLGDQFRKTFNQMALKKYAGVPDVVLMDSLPQHRDIFVSSEGLGEGIADTIRSMLISLKNFFLRLWANVVAFFKQLFDQNSKVRNTLLKRVNEFTKHRSTDYDARINQMQTYLPTVDDTVNLIQDLNILFNDAMAMSKMTTIKTAAQYKKGVLLFGYQINDGQIIEDSKLKRQIRSNRITFGSVWTIDKFIEITQQFASLCTDTGKLNAVRTSLENDVKFATYNIDKYLALGDDSKAEQLQYELNDKSLRSSYVFKSAAILQSYVSQMTTMLLDTWENINSVM